MNGSGMDVAARGPNAFHDPAPGLHDPAPGLIGVGDPKENPELGAAAAAAAAVAGCVPNALGRR